MTKSSTNLHCNRVLQSKEIMLSDADLDAVEAHILTIARFYFQSFAVPESHSWIGALQESEAAFGDIKGPLVGTRLLGALMAVRQARKSVYCFNSPTCPDCAAIVTEHERRFTTAIRAIRTGRKGHAKTELMMLCEGNDTRPSLDALTRLVSVLPKRVAASGEAAYV
ncbi:hypothetical protein [Thalassobium sp. R2A62]|jgi:hypothetical protein|uniref:hypothetical protein n=1 Tax=Thalassobium sp. R2A62 TaxID=633131 RepID=UPI0001B1D272|nr:hypothetical protein [Thalassobium sp. R2A62]EET47261.1 hypothetical protein TR2A62_0922 [Thalassobium sp. R2A62]